MPSEVSKYLSRIGRRGGRSKSAAKLAAVRVNLKKAQAARRKYPRCPRYKNRSHRFSPTTERCACGYIKRRWKLTAEGFNFCEWIRNHLGDYCHHFRFSQRIDLKDPRRDSDSQKSDSLPRSLACPSCLVPPFFVMLRSCVSEILICALLEHRRISAGR